MRLRSALAASMLLTSCSQISFDNQDAVDGTYVLRRVRNSNPPVLLDDRTVAFTVASGVLTLGAKGEWSEVLTGTVTENGQTVPRQLTESGSWTLRRPYVELVRTDGATAYVGEFSVISGPKLDLQRPMFSKSTLYVYAR